jgi:phosphoribosylamine--glycine ligase
VVAALRVLVIGSGGREHALSLALSRDPAVVELHAAPGNPGTAQVGANHPIDPLDGAAVASLAARFGVNLVIVGPEAPLVAGVADAYATRASPASDRLQRQRNWKAVRRSPSR